MNSALILDMYFSYPFLRKSTTKNIREVINLSTFLHQTQEEAPSLLILLKIGSKFFYKI